MKSVFRPLDLTLIAMFVALMAIGSNIVSFVPFMTVGSIPITLQTFFAILAGLVLGSRLGSMAMIVYMFVGLVGVPVFAKFGAGFSTIVSPSFGFIVSFIFTAYFTGKLIERKSTITFYIAASVIGLITNYFIGTSWMYAAYKLWLEAPAGFTYSMAWSWMVIFIPKDLILAVLAGLLAHRLERTVLSKGKFKTIKKTA